MPVGFSDSISSHTVLYLGRGWALGGPFGFPSCKPHAYIHAGEGEGGREAEDEAFVLFGDMRCFWGHGPRKQSFDEARSFLFKEAFSLRRSRLTVH